MSDMIATAMASMIGSMISKESVNKMKANAFEALTQRIKASPNKYDDQVLEILGEEAVKELLQMVMLELTMSVDRLAKSTDTRFDDALVDIFQKVTGITDEDMEMARAAEVAMAATAEVPAEAEI